MKTYIVKSLFIASALSLVACKNDNPDQLTEGKTKKEIVSFAPKVTGRILKIFVEEGQTVKAGDTLAMLDVPEVSAKIAALTPTKQVIEIDKLSKVLAAKKTTGATPPVTKVDGKGGGGIVDEAKMSDDEWTAYRKKQKLSSA